MDKPIKRKIRGSAAVIAADTTPEASAKTEDRQQQIATAAYYRAELRGFEPGHELEDWLAAEARLNDSA